MFDAIRDSASDEIPLSEDRVTKAEIDISDTPVMSDTSGTLVVEASTTEESQASVPVQIHRVDKVLEALAPRLSGAIPAVRNGVQRITPQIKREISRIRLVKSAEEVDTRYFSIDRTNRTALLTGDPFPLECDERSVRKDAGLLLEYFKNYEEAFEGNVANLQRDYFILTSWLYFSPFMCDLRNLALLQDSDVIRYPLFAIVFGKSSCGKTSLVDTLMKSMYGYLPDVDKESFTRAKLRGIRQHYKRLPVVFDDIGRRAFNAHGKDMIKHEGHPNVEEYPGFVVSMNAAEPQSFPDEVVRRSLMIYTTTALPPHDEELRQRLQGRVQDIRNGFTGHLYRRYLTDVMDRLDDERLPEDWLVISSEALSNILTEAAGSAPSWCQPVTWLAYAEKRYDRVKARLANLLRESTHARTEGESPNGWMVDGDKIIIWEQRDAFGRRGFDWEDVPSTLIDEDASSGNRTVLHRASLERFLGQRIGGPRPWWKPWAKPSA